MTEFIAGCLAVLLGVLVGHSITVPPKDKD